MRVLVVGGGGREHAIIRKLKESKKITEIYALPGNGGMYKDATAVAIGSFCPGICQMEPRCPQAAVMVLYPFSSFPAVISIHS